MTPLGTLPLWHNHPQEQLSLLLGHLPPRTITPIGKLSGIMSTAPPSLTGNWVEMYYIPKMRVDVFRGKGPQGVLDLGVIGRRVVVLGE